MVAVHPITINFWHTHVVESLLSVIGVCCKLRTFSLQGISCGFFWRFNELRYHTLAMVLSYYLMT